MKINMMKEKLKVNVKIFFIKYYLKRKKNLMILKKKRMNKIISIKGLKEITLKCLLKLLEDY
jgi:hypothetical protein